MISKKVEAALNNQISLEGQSSQFYLAMASWAENKGFGGTCEFLYRQADEERIHMLKLVRYVNERGGTAIISQLNTPPTDFESLVNVFKLLLSHELNITAKVNDVVHVCMEERDYTTTNFMQWFLSEQIEEEATARSIMDRINLIGNDKGGLYLFDRDLENLTGESIAAPSPGQ